MRNMRLTALLGVSALLGLSGAQCPLYQQYSNQLHEPFSPGKHNLSYARPIPACRTFYSQEVEDEIQRMKSVIADPDLFRLFENTWPSTLDTTIAWRGWSNATVKETQLGIVEEEPQELSFVITGKSQTRNMLPDVVQSWSSQGFTYVDQIQVTSTQCGCGTVQINFRRM